MQSKVYLGVLAAMAVSGAAMAASLTPVPAANAKTAGFVAPNSSVGRSAGRGASIDLRTSSRSPNIWTAPSRSIRSEQSNSWRTQSRSAISGGQSLSAGG